MSEAGGASTDPCSTPELGPRPELDRRLERLFGQGIDWRRETGVLHVTAIGSRPRAAIAVGPAAPRSRTDRFVLGFARARADAIVTTGAILRAEPELVHRTSDDALEADAWTHWRSEVLGRTTRPLLLVLSASGEIDLHHPALAAAPRAIVWTTASGRARIGRSQGRIEIVTDGDRSGASERVEVEVGSADGPTRALFALSAAIRWLRRSASSQTVVIEAGPRSTQGLYALDPSGAREVVSIDELLLSVYAGGSFPSRAGPDFPTSERLAAYFSSAEPRARARVDETSATWLFERYRRP